jgi:hypothetical protein
VDIYNTHEYTDDRYSKDTNKIKNVSYIYNTNIYKVKATSYLRILHTTHAIVIARYLDNIPWCRIGSGMRSRSRGAFDAPRSTTIEL